MARIPVTIISTLKPIDQPIDCFAIVTMDVVLTVLLLLRFLPCCCWMILPRAIALERVPQQWLVKLRALPGQRLRSPDPDASQADLRLKVPGPWGRWNAWLKTWLEWPG